MMTASVLQDDKILEMDGDDGCITMSMCLMPLDYNTEKWVRWYNKLHFMYILAHFKKENETKPGLCYHTDQLQPWKTEAGPRTLKASLSPCFPDVSRNDTATSQGCREINVG